jgi:hypothetical protein
LYRARFIGAFRCVDLICVTAATLWAPLYLCSSSLPLLQRTAPQTTGLPISRDGSRHQHLEGCAGHGNHGVAYICQDGAHPADSCHGCAGLCPVYIRPETQATNPACKASRILRNDERNQRLPELCKTTLCRWIPKGMTIQALRSMYTDIEAVQKQRLLRGNIRWLVVLMVFY